MRCRSRARPASGSSCRRPGTHYGLKQNFWFDSRRDVVAATEGALTYLQKLHGDFGDWQLALAGYNWGEGNVARAVARNQKLGLPADYANLKMPDETRNYLPKLQALKNIVRDPEKYCDRLDRHPGCAVFRRGQDGRARSTCKVAAQLAEMPVDEFLYLNPQHNRPVIAGADDYTILLPIDKAELFAAKLQLTNQPLVSWQAYRMRNGETLPQIAAKFGLEVGGAAGRERHRRESESPRRAHAARARRKGRQRPRPTRCRTAVFTTVPQGRTFYYRVKRGETLAGVAARYAVSPADLKRWNGLTTEQFAAGQTLRITSDFAPAAGKAKRAAGARPRSAHPESPRSKPPQSWRSRRQ